MITQLLPLAKSSGRTVSPDGKNAETRLFGVHNAAEHKIETVPPV